MIRTLAIENYRSLRRLTLAMGGLNVVTGANGTGKSSLYRALRLLSEAASGGIVRALAHEGGLASTLWAGPDSVSRAMRSGEHPIEGGPRKNPVRLRLGFTDGSIGFSTELGLPPSANGDAAGASKFKKDPVIKRECVWAGEVFHPSGTLASRHGSSVEVREEPGGWSIVSTTTDPCRSILTEVADPVRAPMVLMLRERVRSWRFYDHFRTDADAPARQPQVGTRTPVLAHDGSDVAAALETIREVGDGAALDAAIADAFSGSTLEIEEDEGRFTALVRHHGLLRPLRLSEISDGTLRYLMWVAALLTPRPPELMVLDEPETSLHPDLLPALGRLIVQAAARSQVWVVTHSSMLIAALERSPDCRRLELEKEHGESRLAGQTLLRTPQWRWPDR